MEEKKCPRTLSEEELKNVAGGWDPEIIEKCRAECEKLWRFESSDGKCVCFDAPTILDPHN